MTRYGMAIDLSRCIGCYDCQIACKDEHVGNDFPPISVSQPTFGHFWLSIDEHELVLSPSHIKVAYIPKPCQHCSEAPCIAAGQNEAVYRRPDGIVIIDPEKAAGQKQIVESCPYRVVFWNEEKNLPQMCTMCAHLLDDGWTEPRCVQTCPTNCIHFGDLDDPDSEISKFIKANNAEELLPELNTRPSVRYVGLPKRHITGTIVCGDTDGCAADVTVTLEDLAGKTKVCRTDAFGYFDFDDVAKGKHFLRCEIEGCHGHRMEIEALRDVEYLGDIFVHKRT